MQLVSGRSEHQGEVWSEYKAMGKRQGHWILRFMKQILPDYYGSEIDQQETQTKMLKSH